MLLAIDRSSTFNIPIAQETVFTFMSPVFVHYEQAALFCSYGDILKHSIINIYLLSFTYRSVLEYY